VADARWRVRAAAAEAAGKLGAGSRRLSLRAARAGAVLAGRNVRVNRWSNCVNNPNWRGNPVPELTENGAI
jgi:hypothetical protein